MQSWVAANLLIAVGSGIGYWSSRSLRSTTHPDSAVAPTAPPNSLIRLSRLSDSGRLTFRERLFAQRGRATLETSLALWESVRASAHVPAQLRQIERELSSGTPFDPALSSLRFILRQHLERIDPSNHPNLQSHAASRHDVDDREETLQKWATHDPDAAFAFAQREPVHNHRPRMLAAVLTGAAKTDPEAACRLWKTLTDRDLRHRLAKEIAWPLAPGQRPPSALS